MSKYKIDLHQSKKYLLPKLMVKQFEGNDDELAAFNFAIKQIDYVMAGSFCETDRCPLLSSQKTSFKSVVPTHW